MPRHWEGHDGAMAQAARWLTLAARKGHVGAQARLGELLFTGDVDLPRKPLQGLSRRSLPQSARPLCAPRCFPAPHRAPPPRAPPTPPSPDAASAPRLTP